MKHWKILVVVFLLAVGVWIFSIAHERVEKRDPECLSHV